MALQAMLDNGDEVLVPAPDYPLWTASTSLAGGRPVHYLLRREQRLAAGPRRHREPRSPRAPRRSSSSTRTTRPARCTRERCSRQIAELAREHDLVVLADEIYDKILYDDAVHVPFAAIAPDVFTLTFNGLSKAYRLAGFRSGWLMVTRPEASTPRATSRA